MEKNKGIISAKVKDLFLFFPGNICIRTPTVDVLIRFLAMTCKSIRCIYRGQIMTQSFSKTFVMANIQRISKNVPFCLKLQCS